jgi:hypothetical protein
MATRKRGSEKGSAGMRGTAESTNVEMLVGELSEKDDNKRYKTFLTLRALSQTSDCVYPYWDQLEAKLSDPNSYQRSIGLMLLSENVRWDRDRRFRRTIKRFLAACNDDKFITARQCLQGLVTIVQSTPEYDKEIQRHLAHLTFSGKKENQTRLLQKDAATVLQAIEAKKG